MIKLLVGIYTDEGGVVKYITPNFTKKEANQLLDNVLFSANIYGQRSSRKDITFTLPIMYLPGYTHGRIYFKFSSKAQTQQQNAAVLDAMGQSIKDYPISLFCSFKKLDENLSAELISELDNLIWNFLKSSMEESSFFNLVKAIELCVEKIN